MKVYTYSQARQNLAQVLEDARREGKAHIKRRDGREFIIAPAPPKGSALDVKGVPLNLTAGEIVRAVREGRERSAASLPQMPARERPRRRRAAG